MLPLSEESQSNGTDDLLKLEDVRVEVMRARGAGGQVRFPVSVLCSLLNLACVTIARQQNRIRGTPHTCTYWDHRLDAGRTESASGTSYIEDDKSVLHLSRRTNDEHFKFCGHG